jgi:DsbC/DsbD-like thiol-disulfide interchange protein
MVKHSRFFILLALMLIPASLYSTPLPQSAADVKVSGSLSPDKTRRGRSVRGTVVMEIPAGLHVQSNRPLDKFLVPTKLDIEVPQGVRTSAAVYPRPILRNLKFSKAKVAVYEGRALIRFNVAIPANFNGNSVELKGRLRFQACNDDACFPPITREVKMWVGVD